MSSSNATQTSDDSDSSSSSSPSSPPTPNGAESGGEGGEERKARIIRPPYVITTEPLPPPTTFWERFTQGPPQRDYNPYLPSYINYGEGHAAQAWTIIAACIGFIIAQALVLGYAESQAGLLVGLVCIMTLMSSLAVLIVLMVGVINGPPAYTLHEAMEVLHRPWNVLSAFLAFVLFVAGVILFVADLCILAFDALDDEHHAIWATIFMGGCFLVCCFYSAAMFVANYPPIHKYPHPNPLAPTDVRSV